MVAFCAVADLGQRLVGFAAEVTEEDLLGQRQRPRQTLSRDGDALGAEPLLPRRMALFAQLGEKMQDLSAPLAQLRESAESDYREALARFERGTVLLLYLVLGVAVGVLVVAVYLPIFKLGSLV